MARKKTMKQMGDEAFDPAKTVGKVAEGVARIPGAVVDFLAKRAYITTKEIEDTMSNKYYSRRSKGLNKLDASGASLDMMKAWAEKTYPKKNKGGR